MAKYKLHYTGQQIIETLENDQTRYIPVDETNWAYQIYQEWLKTPGNVPDPADPAPLPDPADVADQVTFASLAVQYAMLKAGIRDIKTDMDTIIAGPALPTNAQVGGALKLLAKDLKTTMTGLDMLIDNMAIFARRATGGPQT